MLNCVEENFQQEENRRCAGGNGVQGWQRNCRVWERERKSGIRERGARCGKSDRDLMGGGGSRDNNSLWCFTIGIRSRIRRTGDGNDKYFGRQNEIRQALLEEEKFGEERDGGKSGLVGSLRDGRGGGGSWKWKVEGNFGKWEEGDGSSDV